MITRKHLSRRTLLRGAGTALALPFLDAMAPAFAGPRAGGKNPTRMAFVYVPNGIDMPNWTPKAAGSSFELPSILEPLQPYRENMLVISGLTQNNGRALGDGPGDHARAAASFLTGVHPKKTAGADIALGPSVDQVAAQQVGSATRFPSLELGLEDGRMVGSCDSGYSCAYSNSISWRSATSPMPPEVNPKLVFERLFAGIDTSLDPAARERRRKYDQSILDFVLEDTKRLKGTLGATDRRKIDEYLYAIREIEKRIQDAGKEGREFTPAIEAPAGVPVEYADHAKLMFDILAVAFQADLTRIGTFMMAREGSGRTYREIGVPDGHHGLTHHRGNEEWIRKVAKINRFHVELFTQFLAKLKSTPDGEGTLLDHSMIVYGSGLSDGNRHLHHDLPVAVFGRANGWLRTGRHLQMPKETPMNNLFISMLDHMGVNVEQLGDSNGRVAELTEMS